MLSNLILTRFMTNNKLYATLWVACTSYKIKLRFTTTQVHCLCLNKHDNNAYYLQLFNSHVHI